MPKPHEFTAPLQQIPPGVGSFHGVSEPLGEAGLGDFAGQAGFAAPVPERTPHAVQRAVDALPGSFPSIQAGVCLPVRRGNTSGLSE